MYNKTDNTMNNVNDLKTRVTEAFNRMCEADGDYRRVLTEAIKECGEVAVVDENENFYESETPCYHLTYYDGERVWHYDVDKLKVENNNILFHTIRTNFDESDEWVPVEWVAEQVDFLYESIVWPSETTEEQDVQKYIYILKRGDEWLSNGSLVLCGVFTDYEKLSAGALKLVTEYAEKNYEQEAANGMEYEDGLDGFIESCHDELLKNSQYLGETSFIIEKIEADMLI